MYNQDMSSIPAYLRQVVQQITPLTATLTVSLYLLVAGLTGKTKVHQLPEPNWKSREEGRTCRVMGSVTEMMVLVSSHFTIYSSFDSLIPLEDMMIDSRPTLERKYEKGGGQAEAVTTTCFKSSPAC